MSLARPGRRAARFAGGAVALAAVAWALLAWAGVGLEDVPSFVEDLWGRVPYEPAYTATDADFEAAEQGIGAVLSVAPELFPKGVGDIDVVLYDSRTLYVYSRAPSGDAKAHRTWREYSVTELSAVAPPTRRSMKACSASEGYTNWRRARSVTRSDSFFMCAPSTTFQALQRGWVYETRESYLATFAHEYGHQYLDRWRSELPEARALSAKVEALQTATDREAILHEAYAIWIELQASQRLFPAHFARLSKDFTNETCRAYPEEAHCLGLKLALELMNDAGR